MKNNIIRKTAVLLFIFGFLYILSYGSGSFLGYSSQAPQVNNSASAESEEELLSNLKTLFSETATYKRIASDSLEVLDSSKKRLGRVLYSLPDCEEYKGYAGPIQLLIGIDLEEKIKGVKILDSLETPSFLNRITKQGLLEKWNGLTASEAINLEVDAVTRATMSSSCIINSVRKKLSISLKLSMEQAKLKIKELYNELLAWFFLVLAVGAYIPKSPIAKYRKSLLVLSIIIPGFFLCRFISLGLLKSWAIEGIPYPSNFFMVFLVSIAIFFPMFLGRGFYCVWYCPYGAAQELCGHLCKKKLNISGKKARFLSKARTVFLAIILVLILWGPKINLYQFEPFSAFSYELASTIAISIALVFLVLSIVIPKPWCNYFCPTGCFIELCRDKNMGATAKEKTKEKVKPLN